MADLNETHLFNPKWPPHAKFHCAYAAIMATVAGICALFTLRHLGKNDPLETKLVCLRASLGFIAPACFALMLAGLFPGAGHYDPELGAHFSQEYEIYPGWYWNHVHTGAVGTIITLLAFMAEYRNLKLEHKMKTQ